MVTAIITSTQTTKLALVEHALSQTMVNLFNQDPLEATLRFALLGLKECGCLSMNTHPAQGQALVP